MPQRNVATNFTFEQQRQEINLLAADFWTHKTTTDTAAPTYLKHDGSNDFTGQTLVVPNAFTINSNGGAGTVTISGNLDVTGTTTTVSSANLEVTDKNILISKGSTTDAQADGAGITIDSATDITFNFVDAKDALVSSIGLEATTFLKAPYGQFLGSGTPTTGQGVEINAPDTNTGQISSYDRANTAYKELRIKGSSVGIYGGTSNALVGSFNSTGLAMESGKTITSGNITISTDTDASFFINTTNVNGAHLRLQTSGTNKTFLGQAAGIAGTLGSADDFAIRSAGDIALSTNNDNSVNFLLDTSGNAILKSTNAAFKSESSSSGDYVRMYAGGGTGKWDIYGNGANLRFSDNDSAGNIVFDRNVDANGGLDVTGNTSISGKTTIGTTTTNTSDSFTIMDPGNVFMSIRSDNIALGNYQILDFATGAADRASANMTGSIAAEIMQESPLKSDLCFSTNKGDSISQSLKLRSSGTLESFVPSDATPNFKFRSDDVNWHGYLNQTVEGGSISTSLSCGGSWTVNGSTYDATKDLNGTFETNALVIHNQYDNGAGGFVFLNKAAGSTTTDGTVNELLRIQSNGKLISSVGTEISHQSGGDKLVYADVQEYGVSDNDNGYKTMKTWKADKGGSFTLDVSMMIQSGTYYYSYIVYNVTQGIRVNQTGGGNDSNNLRFNDGLASGQSANVHQFRRFSITCGATLGSVRSGDQLELRMASTQIDGTIITGNGQRLRARGLKIFSTTGNPGTGAVNGAGYNAAMNTRNCCYWWLDRNGDYNNFNSQTEASAIPFNRLVENANFSDDDHSNGVVTIQQDGVYALNASAYSIGSAFTQGWWIVDGVRHNGCDIVLASTSSIMSMSGFMYLTAGQTVGFHPHYSGSTAITIKDNTYHTYFRGCLINATSATRDSYA